MEIMKNEQCSKKKGKGEEYEKRRSEDCANGENQRGRRYVLWRDREFL